MQRGQILHMFYAGRAVPVRVVKPDGSVCQVAMTCDDGSEHLLWVVRSRLFELELAKVGNAEVSTNPPPAGA